MPGTNTRPVKKTRQMLRSEDRIQAPLERYLPARLNGGAVHDGALLQLAEELDVSIATANYWLLKLGIRCAGVAVRPGDRVYAIAADGAERLALEVR